MENGYLKVGRFVPRKSKQPSPSELDNASRKTGAKVNRPCGWEYLHQKGISNRGLREWHNEALHNLYSAPNVIRAVKSRRSDGHGMKILAGEHESMGPVERRRGIWENNRDES
jgi:hypothetical protein